MINARHLMLFINAEKVPFLLDDEIRSWELAEYAENLAGRIAARAGIEVTEALSLSPSGPFPSKAVAASKAFRECFQENIKAAIPGCDGIAILPGLSRASEMPLWLKDEAERLYVPIAPFRSFFGGEDSSLLEAETSRKRISLVKARIPQGREGRGGRQK